MNTQQHPTTSPKTKEKACHGGVWSVNRLQYLYALKLKLLYFSKNKRESMSWWSMVGKPFTIPLCPETETIIKVNLSTRTFRECLSKTIGPTSKICHRAIEINELFF